MDSDEERVTGSNTKQYAALRSDLSAALAAFDRAQDWAVSAVFRFLPVLSSISYPLFVFLTLLLSPIAIHT